MPSKELLKSKLKENTVKNIEDKENKPKSKINTIDTMSFNLNSNSKMIWKVNL